VGAILAGIEPRVVYPVAADNLPALQSR
jgi:hypothetical protein